MRPWQDYLLSKCPPESFSKLPPEARDFNKGHWRFADYSSFYDDVVRCYGPVAATCLSMAYRPRVVVEMGVYSGSTSLILARANPEAEVHGVDINTEVAGFPVGLTVLTHGARNFTLHQGNSWDFNMPGVGLCFIDADHTGDAPYRDSLRAWANRPMGDGGEWCIAWDDYHESNTDVVRCVDRFVGEVGMELHKLMSWYYIGTLLHSAVEAFL